MRHHSVSIYTLYLWKGIMFPLIKQFGCQLSHCTNCFRLIATSFLATILHQSSPNFNILLVWLIYIKHYFFWKFTPKVTYVKHRSKFKNQNCSRLKLLCHTIPLFWPKLLCSRSNTRYIYSLFDTPDTVT